MGRRGRRQVLQLDDSSNSHQSKKYSLQGQQNDKRFGGQILNPLLTLVGDYQSDSDADDSENTDDEPVNQKVENDDASGFCTVVQAPLASKSKAAVPVESGSAINLPTSTTYPVEAANVIEDRKDLDSEVANFLAEIESISAESVRPGDESKDIVSSTTAFDEIAKADKPDFGYIIKSDVSSAVPDNNREKKVKSSGSNAYKYTFVKGESEFVKPEDSDLAIEDISNHKKMEKNKGEENNEDDELPEEPISLWQLVQDESTQYYYYWNTVTNEVTWEIPPNYTQFLLLHKEYEERVAKIPQNKLDQLKKKREARKVQEELAKEAKKTSSRGSRESSPAAGSRLHKSKHKKHTKHSKENSRLEKHDAVSFPQPPSSRPDLSESEVDSTMLPIITEIRAPVTLDSHLSSEGLDAPETSSTQSVLSKTASASATSLLVPDAPWSPCVAQNSAGDVEDAVKSDMGPPLAAPVCDHVPEDGSLEQEEQDVTSPVTSSSRVLDHQDKTDSEMATPARVSSTVAEEEDDFDVDFDDIDDLDRALEKALERKLEKKKAELRRLEQGIEGDSKLSYVHYSKLMEFASQPYPGEEHENVSAESTPLEVEMVSSSGNKRAVSNKDDSDEEPKGKRAKLVAYDLPEESEEEEELPEEFTESAILEKVKDSKEGEDDDGVSTLISTPKKTEDWDEVEEFAEMALHKLSFLEVNTEGLSHLQTVLVQLQTRLLDWKEGGLNGEYFYQRVREVNTQLLQFETSSVPDGWVCSWDRNYRRYFYTEKETGKSQWDYPESASYYSGDIVDQDMEVATAPTSEQPDTSTDVDATAEEALPSHLEAGTTIPLIRKITAMAEKENNMSAAIEEEDLDGVAMSNEELELNEAKQDKVSKIWNKPSHFSKEDVNQSHMMLQTLFPGEPLPPGTELLLGLPPPPPPPLPQPDDNEENVYIGKDDFSDEESNECGEEDIADNNDRGADQKLEAESNLEVDENSRSNSDVSNAQEDSVVISRQPQLKQQQPSAPSLSSAAHLYSSAGGASTHGDVETSSVLSAPPLLKALSVLSAPPQPNAEAHGSGHYSSAVAVGQPVTFLKEDFVDSPTSALGVLEDAGEPKHEKHKKKKKEKLSSGGFSLKKKGVSSLVQKWQKVKREVEREERANEQRQMAIKLQLEEWKKENT